MGTITLTLPSAGNFLTAGLHSANYAAIQAVINGGLQNVNIAADAAIAVSKIAAGTNGQTLFTTGGAPAWGDLPADTRYRSTATVDVATTTTETDIFTQSIGAGVMGTDKMLRLNLVGDYLHNNVAGDTATIRVKFGGTTFVADATNFGNVVGAARHPWILRVLIFNLGAANSQMISVLWVTEDADTAAPSSGIGKLESAATNNMASALGISTLGTIDTASAQNLVVSVQWSASSANNSFRKRAGAVEIV